MASSRSGVGRMLVAASLIAVVADQSPDGNVQFRPAVSTVHTTIENLNVREKKFEAANCEFGIPQMEPKSADILGPTTIIVRETYVLEHSTLSKTAYWVSEVIKADNLTGPDQGRLSPEPFQPEPWVNRGSRAEKKDYVKSGFARGHMMPDADRSRNEAKAETYYLSNMVPQYGPFNSGVWLSLEKAVRSWSCTRGKVLVITGPLWYDPKEDDPATADGLVEHKVIGANQVAVPTHLYKILLSQNPTTKEWESLAFRFPNKPDFKSSPALEEFLITIDWIEEHTGFNFFPEFPAAEQKKLEALKASRVWDADAECMKVQKLSPKSLRHESN